MEKLLYEPETTDAQIWNVFVENIHFLAGTNAYILRKYSASGILAAFSQKSLDNIQNQSVPMFTETK
jgi:hypothetical protein